MQKYLRYCPICGEENIRKDSHSKIYVPGCVWTYNHEPTGDTYCMHHEKQKHIILSVTCEEFKVLRCISNEPSFILAMNDLKEKDIIEYNLKLSQFRTQVEQQENNNVLNNTPKCPICNSTNINKISGLSKAGSVAMWGIFSRKVHKQWHCNNCKSDF